MLPTAEDFEPRRDGWFEHRGTWGEVTVGTVIATYKRTERWEVIAVGHGLQVEFGHTLWMRVREQTTGEEFSINPKPKNLACRILTLDPRDTETAPPTAPSDQEAIRLLVSELGALHLATWDSTTGETTCPEWGIELDPERQFGRAKTEHLRFAHGLVIPDGLSAEELITLHGQSHNPKHPEVGKGGFPHRHVPEDLSILDGVRRLGAL